MFILIFITTLITMVLLIITAATYLINLICDESDDPDASASLAMDFAKPLTASPDLSSFGAVCTNPNHHHHSDDMITSDSSQGLVTPASSELETHPGTMGTSGPSRAESSLYTGTPESFDVDSEISYSSCSGYQQANNTWSTSAREQKNIITTQLGAPASKPLFDDFDAREMQIGGTGLHWCKSRKSLDKLIKLGLPLNLRNKRQETALHVAVRRRKLQVLIGLLGHGADVNCKNEQGETPLILASKIADIYACQLLMIFDADINILDNYGRSARHHISAICEKNKSQPQPPNSAHLILAMLNEMGAERCSENQDLRHKDSCKQTKSANTSTCTDGCAPKGIYNGNLYNKWPDFYKESLYKRHMFVDIIEQRKNELQKGKSKFSNDKSEKPIIENSRMLCIDGGGMRGVIVCQMMIELEKYLKKPVVSYFDWIGGTSVGAFLACALCTGTSLKELRRVSFDVKDEVFNGSKPYNSKFLERVLKRTYGATTRMSSITDKKLAVTTVIADREPCQLRLFRNYSSPSQLLKQYGFSVDEYDAMSGHSMIRRRSSSITNTKKQLGSVADTTNTKKANISVGTMTPNKDVPDKEVLQKGKPMESKKITQESLDNEQVGEKDKLRLPSATITANKDENKIDVAAEHVIDENEQDPLIWQAVRASAAAPFFFKPYGPYLDGGIISNNPTMDMLSEYHNHRRVMSFLHGRLASRSNNIISPRDDTKTAITETPKDLELVVSLGTGRGRVIGRQAMLDFGQVASGIATVFSPVELLRSIRAARDLFKKLMQQSCHTEDHILDRAQAWCSSLNIPYFRINPPLASLFSIDDKRDEQLINALWQAKLYMRAVRPQLMELADLLDSNSQEGRAKKPATLNER